jgi:hypothetical protein
MREEDVRSVTVTAVADSGALRLVMPEGLRRELGLAIERQICTSLADETKKMCGLTEEVRIRWRDRETGCQAWVVPDDCTVLLGAIPMEGMDIMVDPARQRLIGVHGDQPLGILY